MKNDRPIILNCFSRGGSNILWNIFLSHPEACSPIQETLEIFRLDKQGIRGAGIKAAWLTRQISFFNQWNLQTRRPISEAAEAYIDQVLFEWKLKTLADEEMRYKSCEELYGRVDVEGSRLVLKNNNGTIFLSNIFADMYTEPVFFGLVRDPLPLYESHKRHKTPVGASPHKFAAYYQTMVRKMREDAGRWSCYHTLRFEDILRDPIQSIRKVYELAGLDIAKVHQMRFKAKPHMQADGHHATRFQAGRHYWFDFDEIPQLLEPEVNRYQVSMLDPNELEQIHLLTRDIRSQLGYVTE